MAKRRGIKTCPECSTEMGVRTIICKVCNHEFSPAKKKIPVEKKKDSTVERAEPEKLRLELLPLDPYPDLSPDEHADRILDYGEVRAKNLLNQSKRQT